MAAPKGNRNARKGKDWENALRRALAQYEAPATEGVPEVKAGDALRRIAFKVVEHALLGSKDAIAEIGNRLDGKPTEYVEGEIHHTYASALTDDELAVIAAGSSEGVAESQGSAPVSSELH